MAISKNKLAQLITLIQEGKEHSFYLWTDWKTISHEVRNLDCNECVMCRAEGKSGTKNNILIVHHVKHLKDYPELALSINDPDTGERQLVTLCKQHHEKMHPESMRQNINATTTEKYQEYW